MEYMPYILSNSAIYGNMYRETIWRLTWSICPTETNWGH